VEIWWVGSKVIEEAAWSGTLLVDEKVDKLDLDLVVMLDL
jgi:hypothetical protein